MLSCNTSLAVFSSSSLFASSPPLSALVLRIDFLFLGFRSLTSVIFGIFIILTIPRLCLS